eukprot:10314776-Heterocapsa_arctica.AAC.1
MADPSTKGSTSFFVYDSLGLCVGILLPRNMDCEVVFQCPGLGAGADFALRMREGGELVRTGKRFTGEWDRDLRPELASGGRAVVRALKAYG